MTTKRKKKTSKALSVRTETSRPLELDSAILVALRELITPIIRGLDDHTPIIITDGSASIEFAEITHYKRIHGTSVHRAEDLRLEFVECIGRVHTQGSTAGSTFCLRRFPRNVECEIRVIERGNSGFTIHLQPDGHTVEIDFNHTDYALNQAQFPPSGNGNRYGNRGRDIVGLRIFVDGELEHDCEHASTAGVQYTVYDPHA